MYSEKWWRGYQLSFDIGKCRERMVYQLKATEKMMAMHFETCRTPDLECHPAPNQHFTKRQTNHWGGWRWIIEVHKSVWHEFQQPFVELYYSTAHLNHRGKSWTAAKTLWSHLSGMCLADGSASSQIWLWDHDHRDTVYIMIYVYIYICNDNIVDESSWLISMIVYIYIYTYMLHDYVIMSILSSTLPPKKEQANTNQT